MVKMVVTSYERRVDQPLVMGKIKTNKEADTPVICTFLGLSTLGIGKVIWDLSNGNLSSVSITAALTASTIYYGLNSGIRGLLAEAFDNKMIKLMKENKILKNELSKCQAGKTQITAA